MKRLLSFIVCAVLVAFVLTTATACADHDLAGKILDGLNRFRRAFETAFAEKHTGSADRPFTTVSTPAMPERPAENSVPTPAMDRFTGDIGDYRRLGFSQAGATSQLNDPQYGSFPAAYAMDGRRRTSWQEGVGGLGIGETLQLWFDDITCVSVIRIYPGNQMSEYAYYANSRPRQLLVGFSDGTAFTVELEDAIGNQDFILSRPIFTTYIAFTVLDAYTADWQDTSVSEVEAYG